jgi:hypothetical protein
MEYSDFCINVIKLANNEIEYNQLINIFDENSDINEIEDTYDYIYELKNKYNSYIYVI